MIHVFKAAKQADKPTFLLLHGTGGTEKDLLPLADMIDPDAAVLSVRGNVSEHGMPRFFKRLAEGIFDEEDLIFRTGELRDFLDEAAEKYEFDRDNIIAIGYSNGANIAASLLYHFSDSIKGAILHHPMVPRRNITLAGQQGTPIFITAGDNDPICPKSEAIELEQTLQEAGADASIHWESNGHSLTHTEVQAAAEWYRKHF